MRARARGLVGAAAVAIGFGGLIAPVSAEAQSLCGQPGQPACPLEAWMRSTLAAKLADGDAAALGDGLEKAAKMAPDPAWSSWATLAMSGAAAAKKGDIAGARAACKGCHDAWREAYRAKHRLRPMAEGARFAEDPGVDSDHGRAISGEIAKTPGF